VPTVIFVSCSFCDGGFAGLFFWQRWGCSTTKYGGASFGVELLHALVISGFLSSSGGLVGLDTRDVVGIVDVP
jgi:hypothetical protein